MYIYYLCQIFRDEEVFNYEQSQSLLSWKKPVFKISWN